MSEEPENPIFTLMIEAGKFDTFLLKQVFTRFKLFGEDVEVIFVNDEENSSE